MTFSEQVIGVIGNRINTVYETGDALQVFSDWEAVSKFYDNYEKEIWDYIVECADSCGETTMDFIVSSMPYPHFVNVLDDFKRALIEIVLVNVCDDYLDKSE